MSDTVSRHRDWDNLMRLPAFGDYLRQCGYGLLIESHYFADFLNDRGLALTPPRPAPPVSYEAEQAVLGAVMMSEPALQSATTTWGLRPRHFHSERHRTIYTAIATARKKAPESLIDVVTVSEQLKRMGKMEEVGGAYLVGLIEACPNAANVHAYATAVLECARLRSLMELGERLESMAATREVDPLQLVGVAQDDLEAIEVAGPLKDWNDVLQERGK